jgi:hypothetical protein
MKYTAGTKTPPIPIPKCKILLRSMFNDSSNLKNSEKWREEPNPYSNAHLLE